MDAAKGQPAQPPHTSSLAKLRAAAAGCTACPLYLNATQTVFGEGPAHASIVMVGEQPGDREDKEGHPFIGPAGQLLAHALEEAGVDRKAVYITNAVKHFKWKPRGKRRLHERPNARDIVACRPWLEAELGAIKPEFLVLLGSTAAQAVLGGKVRVLKERGTIRESPWCARTLITVHPSSILRITDKERRARELSRFVDDLRRLAQ